MSARNGDVSIAYETVGDGPPVLLMQGLGYARRGWGPAIEKLASIVPRDLLRQPRDRRERQASRSVHGTRPGRGRGRGARRGRRAARARGRREPRRDGGAGARDRVPGARRPARARVYDAGRRGRVSDPGADARAVRRGADARAGRRAAEVRRELAELERAGRADRGDLQWRLANPPDPAGWQAQAAAGTTYDGGGRTSEISAPTLVVHGTEDNVVDTRNAELLGKLIPDARVELLQACGHLMFWEQPERFAVVVEEFLS